MLFHLSFRFNFFLFVLKLYFGMYATSNNLFCFNFILYRHKTLLMLFAILYLPPLLLSPFS